MKKSTKNPNVKIQDLKPNQQTAVKGGLALNYTKICF